jgi:hypothetical protein
VGQAAEAELEKLRASSVGAPVEWGENIAFVSSFMGKPMNFYGKTHEIYGKTHENSPRSNTLELHFPI